MDWEIKTPWHLFSFCVYCHTHFEIQKFKRHSYIRTHMHMRHDHKEIYTQHTSLGIEGVIKRSAQSLSLSPPLVQIRDTIHYARVFLALSHIHSLITSGTNFVSLQPVWTASDVRIIGEFCWRNCRANEWHLADRLDAIELVVCLTRERARLLSSDAKCLIIFSVHFTRRGANTCVCSSSSRVCMSICAISSVSFKKVPIPGCSARQGFSLCPSRGRLRRQSW